MLLTDRTFRTLLSREVLRFTRVWMQTILPQILTSLLYLVVFGIALGTRIREIEGVPYLEYILPGIALMSLVTNSQMNSSWSVFDAKRERYIDEVLISPMSDLQIALAYSLGGTLRGVVMGGCTFLVGVPFVGITVPHPLSPAPSGGPPRLALLPPRAPALPGPVRGPRGLRLPRHRHDGRGSGDEDRAHLIPDEHRHPAAH